MRPSRFALLALRRVALAAAGAALWAVAPGAGAAPATHEIRDPHYGDTLFHFFQDHYFTAVTTLMVSQHFDRVAHHADEAEVLRGGMLASYGMTHEAGAIFARLIERGAAPAVRDRAWFYLAKIRYQRGYLAEAEEALGQVGPALPAELVQERALLQASLLMARAEYAGAATVLDALPGKAPGARYVRYNLGIALIKAGDTKRGQVVLDALGKESAEDEEYRSLRDRANVALGFAALAGNEPKAARTYLERVRLQGLHANKALLGFGWAADALKEPTLALVPWLELAGRDLGDSAVLEAQIAVPYAYAEVGAYRQSLDGYNVAIAAFERENAALAESIQAIRSGTLIDALVERNPGEEMGWFWTIQDLPDMPRARHLAQVLAQHEFQEALKNYRDLRFLQKNLDEWREKLVVFDDMLATRRKAFAERLPQVRQREGAIDLEALARRRDALAAEIARGEAEGDGVAFADAKQLALLARVRSVERGLAAAGAAADARLRDRARIATGLLGWQLAQDYPARAWETKKEQARIDAELAQASRRDAALAQAQRDEPARFDAFGARIAAVGPVLGATIPRVAALAGEERVALQDIAVAELTRQRERLAAYTTQARFAVAQLYDRAYAKQAGTSGADHAVARP